MDEGLPHTDVSACFQLNEDEFLVGTPSSLSIFSRTTGNMSVVEGLFATSMLKVGEKLLITSYEGCWIFDLPTRTLTKLNDSAAKSACLGKDGSIYFGTVKDGLLCYDGSFRRTGQFLTESRRSPEVSCVFSDDSDVLWIGTIGSGCYRSNANSRRFRLGTVTPGEEGERALYARDWKRILS